MYEVLTVVSKFNSSESKLSCKKMRKWLLYFTVCLKLSKLHKLSLVSISHPSSLIKSDFVEDSVVIQLHASADVGSCFGK